MTNTARIYNFSAGPAVLPVEVLREAQDNLLSLGTTGLGILEISHRSKPFESILEAAQADLRELLGLPADFKILFLSGGASLQFSMVPLNLLGPDQVADYVLTGVWSQKAIAEARKVGQTRVAFTDEPGGFRRVPRPDELSLSERPAYVHVTSNNTIYGTQWQHEPEVGGRALVCDMSSDFLSRPVDVSRYGLIYAGAQKNAGPAGVTVVLLREELLQRGGDKARLPTMLNYKTHVDNNSLYNTPPVFSIYIVHLVLRWLKQQGGLTGIAAHNQHKAGLIYRAIDQSGGFYRGHAALDSRSVMNLTFRLPSEELDARFVKEAKAQGMDGLKGHRSAGGIRASVYNAFPLEGAQVLSAFMVEFARRNG